MSSIPTDQAARHSISHDLHTTFLVEAGAGSGKTTGLINRLVQLVATGTCRIENLAAITFTRKAAAELRSRFQIGLEQELANCTDPILRQRLEHSLNNLHLAFLGTIHSFCSRLLRERPVEAGMAPDFGEIEGLEETLLQERAWQEYLQYARVNNSAAFATLDQLDVRPQDLRESFSELCLYPDVEIISQPCPYPDLSRLRDELVSFIRTYSGALPRQKPDKGWDALQTVILRYLQWDRSFDLSQDRHLLRLLVRLDRKGDVVQNRWPDKDTAKSARDDFATLREDHIAPTLRRWREHRHHPLVQFLLPAVYYHSELRLREHKLNFQDLLMRSAELLRHNVEVRQYFQRRFSHLLVDEFQDTDPIQAEVMMLLTADNPAETDWQQARPRAGSLFVVGDPKQSIYRFRRADISVYQQVKDQILRTGGSVLHLSTNFRSQPGVIDLANKAFGAIFPTRANHYQAEFKPMATHRQSEANHPALVIPLTEASYNKAEVIVSQEAEIIASYIRSLIHTPGNQVKPDDCLILTRKKRHMALYARALEKYGLPYNIAGAGDIASSNELQSLLPLLQAISDTTNSVALAATLRGPFFGFSDQELYLHRQAGGRFGIYSSVPDHAHAASFAAALQTLQQFRSYADQMPPSAAISRIAPQLGLMPLALSGEVAKGQASYLAQALELLRARENDGHTTLVAAVKYLQELLETGLDEDLDIEGQRTPGVRVMNLHKAKGLEAPYVFLANPTQGKVRGASSHVSRPFGGQAVGYLSVTVQKSEFASETIAQPLNWEGYLTEENLYLSAEEDRLLYVAATRARDQLVVGTYAKKPDLSAWCRLEPHLSSAPLLDSCLSEPPQPALTPQPITARQFTAACEAIAQGLTRISQPSYRETTVTAESKFGEVRRRATGKGVTWGNVVHRALELLAQRHNLTRDALQALLQQEGRPIAEADELLALLTASTATAFWQRLWSASEIHTELPFGTTQGNNRLQGVIDIAFREPDGWVLADFKSDHIIDDAHLQELTEYYRPQIRAYADMFTALTGQQVKECGLLFTGRGEYVVVV